MGTDTNYLAGRLAGLAGTTRYIIPDGLRDELRELSAETGGTPPAWDPAPGTLPWQQELAALRERGLYVKEELLRMRPPTTKTLTVEEHRERFAPEERYLCHTGAVITTDSGYDATGRYLVRDKDDVEVDVLLPQPDDLVPFEPAPWVFEAMASAIINEGVDIGDVLAVMAFYRPTITLLVQAVADIDDSIYAVHRPHWHTNCGCSDHVSNFSLHVSCALIAAFVENVELDVDWYDED